MKKRLAEFLLQILEKLIERIVTSVLNWLLAAMQAKWREQWHSRYEGKRTQQEAASKARSDAQAAGDREATRRAAELEAAFARDADLIREMGEAGEQTIASVAAEIPRTVNEATKAAAIQSTRAISKLDVSKSRHHLLTDR